MAENKQPYLTSNTNQSECQQGHPNPQMNIKDDA